MSGINLRFELKEDEGVDEADVSCDEKAVVHVRVSKLLKIYGIENMNEGFLAMAW